MLVNLGWPFDLIARTTTMAGGAVDGATDRGPQCSGQIQKVKTTVQRY
jgi:hypothetical protein